MIMGSRASIAKHPIHPMLVPFPIALWIFSLMSDLIYALGWGGPLWYDIAFYTMAGGLVGGLAAAVPGLIDYLSLTEAAKKKIARNHMILNLGIVAIYILNLWFRMTMTPDAALPVVLSVCAVLLLALSGWLGGELVYVHGVGVESQTDTHKSDRSRPLSRIGM
jgi:uncharacterized membrane protein